MGGRGGGGRGVSGGEGVVGGGGEEEGGRITPCSNLDLKANATKCN